jgi:cytochrome c2
MPITRAESAPPGPPGHDAAEKLPRRPALWTYGLVAAAAGAIGWFAAGVAETPSGTEAPEQAEPEPASLPMTSLPIMPLIGTILAIVVVTAAWLTTESWMAASQSEAVARALTRGDPAQASVLATRYGCGGCHTIPGLPAADGKVGPPLGGLRQRVFIAGVLPNTADNLINWIVEPRTYSPGSAMPVTGISKAEARDIAAWLYAH